MSGRAVEIHVAGTSCRVVTTADEAELSRLTQMVEEKLGAVLPPGRPVTKQALVLAAIALAHDVAEARARAESVATEWHAQLGRLLHRVDEALSASETIAADSPGMTERVGTAGVAAAPPAVAPKERSPRAAPPGAEPDRLREAAIRGEAGVRRAALPSTQLDAARAQRARQSGARDDQPDGE